MFKRAFFGMAIAASVSVAQPPIPRPVQMPGSPVPPAMPVAGRLVRVEMHVVNVHPETMRKLELWSESETVGNKCLLTACQTRKILETIQADDRCQTMAAPAIMNCDSQYAQVAIDSPECRQFGVNMTTRLSLDRSFIQMAIAAEYCDAGATASGGKCCDQVHQQSSMMVHRLNSILTIPTGQSVVMELGRPNCSNRWDVSLGSFFQAEVVASKERHLCLIVTPKEVEDVACAELMPPMMLDCPALCQVAVPAPMVYPHPVMTPQVVMGRALEFVPAQEQEMRQRHRDPRLDKLMNKYEQACSDGDMDKARKLARRCLDIDPTCFMRD